MKDTILYDLSVRRIPAGTLFSDHAVADHFFQQQDNGRLRQSQRVLDLLPCQRVLPFKQPQDRLFPFVRFLPGGGVRDGRLKAGIRKRDFERVIRNLDFRLLRKVRITFFDFQQARTVRLDQPQTEKYVCKTLVPKRRNAEHDIVIRNANSIRSSKMLISVGPLNE